MGTSLLLCPTVDSQEHQGMDPNTLQCPGCPKGHLTPAGLGPENRQWETIPGHHPQPDLRDGRDLRPCLHHPAQTQHDHAQPWSRHGHRLTLRTGHGWQEGGGGAWAQSHPHGQGTSLPGSRVGKANETRVQIPARPRLSQPLPPVSSWGGVALNLGIDRKDE